MSQSEIDRYILRGYGSARSDPADERARYYRREWKSLDLQVAFARSIGYMFTAEEARDRARVSALAARKTFSESEIDAVAYGIVSNGWWSNPADAAISPSPWDRWLDNLARAAHRDLSRPKSEIERFVSDRKDGVSSLEDFDKVRWPYRDGLLVEIVAFARDKGYMFTSEDARTFARMKATQADRVYEGVRLDRVAEGLLSDPHYYDDDNIPFAVLDRYAGPQ